MDELNKTPEQTAPPKRERKTNPMQNFKETYLPFLILGVAAMMVVVFIFGSLGRSGGEKPPKVDTPEDTSRVAQLLQQEADNLKIQAAKLAEAGDYEGAMAVLTGYSAGMNSQSELSALYAEYQSQLQSMVVWSDLSQVPGLSFRTLVADLAKAKTDPVRSDRFGRNYVTTEQFEAILQQLYDNGYVLVSLYDFSTPTADAEGKVTMTPGSVRLPEGKKPIILTQEGVNYYSYTQNCGGFASNLTVGEDGKLTCTMVKDGATVQGNYDLVPILNAFVEAHPDFSYNGARATLAVSGYEGLFGYDISQTASIQAVLDRLQEDGYDIACYTYADMRYADFGAVGIQEDLDKWTKDIQPLLGDVDILVYPTSSDIKGREAYTGSKYETLQKFGFHFYSGVDNGTQWALATSDYVRHQRTVVTPGNMASNPEYYTGMFDAKTVLNPEAGA